MSTEKITDTSFVEDVSIAVRIASQYEVSCKSFTHKDMLNPSDKYEYANNPGVYACSSPLMQLASSQPNSVTHCAFAARQNSCPFYVPDFSISSKASATVGDKTTEYYLTRFRSFNGTYNYKIYTSDEKVLFNLSYTNLSNLDNSVEEEAKQVFINFLEEYIPNYSFQNIDSPIVEQKSNKSYLNSLIS
jgi:hypothetical protein